MRAIAVHIVNNWVIYAIFVSFRTFDSSSVRHMLRLDNVAVSLSGYSKTSGSVSIEESIYLCLPTVRRYVSLETINESESLIFIWGSFLGQRFGRWRDSTIFALIVNPKRSKSLISFLNVRSHSLLTCLVEINSQSRILLFKVIVTWIF